MSNPRHRHPDPLGRLVRRVAAGRHHFHHRGERAKRIEAPARDLYARLDALEDGMREVRTRINALFFAVLTAALGDLAGRVVL